MKQAIKKYSQQELIDRILHNDEEVIGYVYDEFYPSIRHLIVRNSGNNEDSKDIFQEALLVLFQKLRAEDFRLVSTLKTYLYSVASILWHKELRRRRILPVSDISFDTNADQEIIEGIENKEKLDFYRETYEELSPDCKQLIKMFLNNIPIKEITSLMGYTSDQHTKNRQLRCKKTLLARIQSSSKYKELGHG